MKSDRALNNIITQQLRNYTRVLYSLKPESCSMCGAKDVRIEGHHPDYEKPFEVAWLCRKCHYALHHGVMNGELKVVFIRKPETWKIPKDVVSEHEGFITAKDTAKMIGCGIIFVRRLATDGVLEENGCHLSRNSVEAFAKKMRELNAAADDIFGRPRAKGEGK